MDRATKIAHDERTAHVLQQLDRLALKANRLHHRIDYYQLDRDKRELAKVQAQAATLRGELFLLNDAYTGWSRFYHVANTNGHTHRSTRCVTCYSSTEFGWLTDLSGMTDAELVAAIGETACTVCFPGAPTLRGFGDGTSALARLTDAERAAKADAKAERAAAKAAKGITAPDGSVLRDRLSGRVETERAARITASDAVEFFLYSLDRDDAHTESLRDDYAAGAATMVGAIAAKHGTGETELRAEVWEKGVRKAAKAFGGLKALRAAHDLDALAAGFWARA